MRIDVTSIRPYAKLLLSAALTVGDQYEESVYVSFSKSRLYFIDQFRGEFSGSISFSYELEEDEEIFEDRFFHTRTFVALCMQYDMLYAKIDGNGTCVLYNEGEEFSIPNFVDKDYDLYVDEMGEKSSAIHYQLSTNHYGMFKQASKFMGEYAAVRDLSGILVNSHTITSTDGFCLYYRQNVDVLETQFVLSAQALYILLMIEIDNPIELYVSSDRLTYVVGHGEAEIVILNKSDVDIPNVVDNDEFRSRMELPESVVVSKDELKSVLKFFGAFVDKEVNQRLAMRIDSNEKLSIWAMDEMRGNRNLKVESCSPELIGQEIWFSREYVERAINVIADEYISIHNDVDNEGPIIVFSGKPDRSVTVVVVKFEE